MQRAIVDRIDGNTARVLMGDEEVAVYVQLAYLPPHVHEGMVLRARYSIDTAATAARLGKPVRHGE
jgi:hypothetical protein